MAPAILPLTSRIRGPAGVNLSSVCRQPQSRRVRRWRRPSIGPSCRPAERHRSGALIGSPEWFCKRQAPGKGEVVDGAVPDEALDRDDRGEARHALVGFGR